jgi:putative membrane protein
MPWLPGSACVLAMLALTLAAGPVAGQTPAAPPVNLAATANADQNFVNAAAEAGIAEVLAGSLAAERAANPQVREFADRIVADRTATNNRLAELARAQGFNVPVETDALHKQIIARLQQLDGAEFDREYMAAQVAEHEAAVAVFRRQAVQGQVAALRGFAELTLPMLEQQLDQAKEVAAAD